VRQWPDSVESMSAHRDRYGRPAFRRTALAPSLLAAIVLLIGVALIESGGFIVIRYVVAILALVVIVFAFQARHWWWVPVMLGVAVAWNPIYPLALDGPWWVGAQYVVILVFIAAGVLIRVPVTDEDRKR